MSALGRVRRKRHGGRGGERESGEMERCSAWGGFLQVVRPWGGAPEFGVRRLVGQTNGSPGWSQWDCAKHPDSPIASRSPRHPLNQERAKKRWGIGREGGRRVGEGECKGEGSEASGAAKSSPRPAARPVAAVHSP